MKRRKSGEKRAEIKLRRVKIYLVDPEKPIHGFFRKHYLGWKFIETATALIWDSFGR
jgi:hypothetical protein